ncbi:pirin family protein [Polaribacter sp. Hel1_85]|uniref:pirin family protein n=1 Tax=Polaribacter sp. Hel1_85 TaxID=1250005 RepID=UPI00052B8F63|nr:pirin family protein [Polaribacter sp. Hel1_85]KGL62909.1 pirin family protein [Polaribacter sp. Hel1_85]
MKKIIHTATSRGHADHGWLQANHSFSFANFYDPNRTHFGALRVLNDDLIAPSMGFGTHPHDNMEIITIPLKGVLKHKDNMANDWIPVLPGEVQVMSAGTGVYHSEINGSATEHLSLFQLWVIPEKNGVEPRYDQKEFDVSDRGNKLQILVSSFNSDDENSLKIHQDAQISRIDLEENQSFKYKLKSKKHGVYIMTISGSFTIGETKMSSRDAIGVYETDSFTINTSSSSELLLIEVPM